jgi:hypothetical protein
MDNDEIDFTQGKPTKEREIVNHFSGPGEKVTNVPEVDDPIDIGKLEYKELTEELIAEYYQVSERSKALDEIKEMLRRNILKVMGRDESAIRGKFTVLVKSQERKGDVDYKRLLADGEITEEILAAYRKPNTQYQKLEVRKLG